MTQPTFPATTGPFSETQPFAATVVLSTDLYERIRQEGIAAWPAECCGVLVGRLEGDRRVVTNLYPQSNERDDSPHDRFLISPQMILQAEKQALKEGVDILGYYHSHPDCAAMPSRYDQDHAWPFYSYIIVSIRNRLPAEMTSWQLTDDRSRMVPELLEILGPTASFFHDSQ